MRFEWQPYRFTGKELITEHGLNRYDSKARIQDFQIPGFTTLDLLCENYYGISPYAYCFNNPIRFIDIDGRDPGEVFKTVNAAAKDWGKYYNGASILRGKEFSSSIYYISKNGKSGYTYTEANIGKNDRVKASTPPDKKTIKAQIHSHGRFEEGYDNNNFSNGDKWVYYNAGIDGFLTTPDGSLKKYNVRTAKVNVISEDLPSDPKDPERKNQVNPIDVPKIKEKSLCTKKISYEKK